MNTCVYCQSSTNLNTELTISMQDGNKVTVTICDEHAEDATIKTAREAYLKRKEEIQKVIDQAKALGLNISESNGLVIAQAPAPPINQQPAKPQQTVKNDPHKDDLNKGDPDLISTDRLDSHPGMRSVGGSTDLGAVESFQSFDQSSFQDKLGAEARKGLAKMTIYEGREGQPIMVPKIRQDGTGTTKIRIRQFERDRDLQDRFKKMAEDSKNDNVPDFARSGYQNTTRDCPFCRGECEINGEDCPKCKGKGMISVY